MSVNTQNILSKLPIQKEGADFESRSEMFKLFDPNGNGYLSLAEVDKGIRDILQIDEVFNCKPAIMRAFQAAKHCVQTKSTHGDDYIERCEFRLFLVYLRQYFEFYQIFQEIDVTHDRKISLEEFKHAVPVLEKYGIHEKDPTAFFNKIDSNHGGSILFDEFCHFAITQHLKTHEDSH